MNTLALVRHMRSLDVYHHADIKMTHPESCAPLQEVNGSMMVLCVDVV